MSRMKSKIASSVVLAAALTVGYGTAVGAGESTAAPLYKNDPEIVTLIDALGDNSTTILPVKSTPGQRDYSNKMVYMIDRQTAFYCGGGHNVGRYCDAWEYHLGSNTWHELFPREGGEHGNEIKQFSYFDRRSLGDLSKLGPNPEIKDANVKKNYEYTKAWWLKNVVLKNGHLVTRSGGPLMNSHTWDAITYDEKAKKIVWIGGPGCLSGAWELHALFNGLEFKSVEKQMDPSYVQGVWMFDPSAKMESRWIQYRTKEKIPRFEGMGASMTYVPELGKTLYYVAAENVSPPAFSMDSFDVVADKWQALQPSLRSLYIKSAPRAEAQHAYSSKHKKIVAVDQKATYAYDVSANQWTKLNDAVPIDPGDANDARTVFAYDSVSDAWLLAYPSSKQVAAFSLAENKWELLKPQGPPIAKPDYASGYGYFDPRFNVLVLMADGKASLYRYKKTQAIK